MSLMFYKRFLKVFFTYKKFVTNASNIELPRKILSLRKISKNSNEQKNEQNGLM